MQVSKCAIRFGNPPSEIDVEEFLAILKMKLPEIHRHRSEAKHDVFRAVMH